MGFANYGSSWRPERKRDEGNRINIIRLWTPAKSITIAKLPSSYRDGPQVNITFTSSRGSASPVGTGGQILPRSGQDPTPDGLRRLRYPARHGTGRQPRPRPRPDPLPALRGDDSADLDRPRLLFAAVPGTRLDRAPTGPRSPQRP